ncbi:MAG: hypothetical protein AAFX85_11230 [Pseudomonadota bacterium]
MGDPASPRLGGADRLSPKERVAEDAVLAGGPFEVANAPIEACAVEQSCDDGLFAHGRNHRGERAANEMLDECRPASVDVNHAWAYAHLRETSL